MTTTAISDSISDSPPEIVACALLRALQDILQNLTIATTIQPGVAIAHTHFGAIEISPERAAQLLSLPQAVQQQYLTLQLRNFLYEVYYSGERQFQAGSDAATQEASTATWENNIHNGINRSFYDKLHQNNQGKGYSDPGWEVIGATQDLVLVRKQGLTLHVKLHQIYHPEIDRSTDLNLFLDSFPNSFSNSVSNSFLNQDEELSDNDSQMVCIWTPCNRVESGYYLAIGDVGWIHTSIQNQQQNIILLEFNIDAIGAIDLMHFLTTQLNVLSIPFTFRVPYEPENYDRYNAATLWLYKDNYALAQPILQALYEMHQNRFRPEIPLFTKALAPGFAIAELPDSPTAPSDSFGLDRCHRLATSFLEVAQAECAPEQWQQQMLQKLQQAQINLTFPHLNPGCTDVYRVSNQYQPEPGRVCQDEFGSSKS